MFKRILIANRGEIAIRVAKACKELGIITIGIFSTADENSKHLRYMDESYKVGEPPPQASYLNINAIMAAAKQGGAEAIHPGYGFLAENPRFAEACEKTGIVFIGPSSKALSLVGDKIASRSTVKKVGVPIIPGMQIAEREVTSFQKIAKQVGYPVIVKASMGGGGKGMRIVRTPKDLETSIEAGQREAKNAFGDETVYLEKYIERPRHIEFQVLRDQDGKTVHLFERECSIQRRHQKIVEETPSTALDPELRRRMGAAAKKVIEASEYTNAGTVEFLLDENHNFYFLEVNARVQVEHPITEMVTGVDLVRQQIMIAAGAKIDFEQSDISQRGHAIEARIYAEDPENNFLPCPGKIVFLNEPAGPGVRVDSGIFQAWDVPPHYDPILSKLIVWAENRDMAIKRMSDALNDYIILGIKTNLGYLKRIMGTAKFIKGEYHTHFIDENESKLRLRDSNINTAIAAASLIVMESKQGAKSPVESDGTRQPTTPWQEIGDWEICRR
ncbi:MAG: acetyl-CoA carboxylase biotin carboxylase subunit [candidate division WOR-3 bacterium]|nr:MAG: acetyl-CoA carboxylase biotin carboxylase subunit [candidate division WOR-3 bacterium]